MKLKTFTTGLVALALVLLASVQASAQIKTGSTALRAVYDPTNGNIKIANTTSGTLGIQSFDIITLGNGTVGAVSGNPGNVGFLSGSAANFPAFSFITSNTSQFGYNGLFSQAGGANVGSAATFLSPFTGGTWNKDVDLQPGTFWDVGNVAVLGMGDAQILARFLTDPELTPPTFDATTYGQFLVSFNSNGGSFSVTTPMDIVVKVPEPSTYAMAFAGLAFGGFRMWRRRRTA
jgi:hypothetical protein